MTERQEIEAEKVYLKLAADQAADMMVRGLDPLSIIEAIAPRIAFMDSVSMDWVVGVPPRIKGEWFTILRNLVPLARRVEVLFNRELPRLERMFLKTYPDKGYLLNNNCKVVSDEDQQLIRGWWTRKMRSFRRKHTPMLLPLIAKATTSVSNIKLTSKEKKAIRAAILSFENLTMDCYHRLPRPAKPMFLDYLIFDLEHLKVLVANRPIHRSDA